MNDKEHLAAESENFRFMYWSDGILDIRDKADPSIGATLYVDEAEILVKLIRKMESTKQLAGILDMDELKLIREVRNREVE